MAHLLFHLDVVDLVRYPSSSPSFAGDESCILKQVVKCLDLSGLLHLNSFIEPNSFNKFNSYLLSAAMSQPGPGSTALTVTGVFLPS